MTPNNALSQSRAGVEGRAARDCPECGFSLWLPVLALTESEVGLYSDARFAGRCIVSMKDHYDHLSDVPTIQMAWFMEEVQTVAEAIRAATGCHRVNVAILGNAESHVHAHLIPRFPNREALPSKAPWEDPRPRQQLEPGLEEDLIESIRDHLARIRAASKNPVTLLAPRRQVPSPRASVEQTLFDLMPTDEVEMVD